MRTAPPDLPGAQSSDSPLDRALALEPGNRSLALNRAAALEREGLWDEAAEAFRVLTDREPAFAEAWAAAAHVAWRRGDRAGAEDAVLRALSLDPAMESALNLAGVLRFTAGDYAGAAARFRAAAEADPADPDAWYNLADALEALGDGEGARVATGRKHRYAAIERVTLIEVSTPELDDVVRLSDDFGREGTNAP